MESNSFVAKMAHAVGLGYKVFREHPISCSFYVLGGFLSSLTEAVSFSCLLPLISSFTDSENSSGNSFVRQMDDWFHSLGIPKSILAYLSCFAILFILSSISYVFMEMFRGKFIRKLEVEQRSSFFSAIINAPWSRLSALNHGSLINAFTREMDQCRNAYRYIFICLSQLIMILNFAGVLFLLNYKFFFMTFGLVLISYPFTTPLVSWSHAISTRATRHFAQYTDHMVTMTKALKNIKASSLEKYLSEKVNKNFVDVSYDFYVNTSFMAPIRNKIFESMGILVLCATLGVSTEVLEIPMSEALVSIVLLFRLIPSLSSFMNYLSTIAGGLASFDNLEKIKTKCREEKKVDGNKMDLVELESIEFKNVIYKYSEEQELLRNVTFKIKKGEFWAISGKTGCGKTTILDMTAKLLTPLEGDIYYNSELQQNLSEEAVHEKVGYLTQNHYLFEGTLRENLCWGLKEVDESELRRVIKISQLDNLIQNKTLDFKVSESGQNLSGGEKQRVAIARSLLAKKDFILMDEPSSALDGETEVQLFKELVDLKGEIGLLVITHREEFLQYADGVIQLENGLSRVI